MSININNYTVYLMMIAAPVAAAAILYVFQVLRYKKTSYYRVTHTPYLKMRRDPGRFGEYETYRLLRPLERKGARFLFNVYLPKGDNETTEIDVLMIHRNGLFVFESKNYSGWIYGDEYQRYWTQTLPRGRGKRAHKERFLNPIWQNKLHVASLVQTLENPNAAVFSIVVFSDRCVLKNIRLRNNNVSVIHRKDIRSAVKQCCYDCKLPNGEIKRIYDFLYAYSQVSEEEKQKHIDAIEAKKGKPGRGRTKPAYIGTKAVQSDPSPVQNTVGEMQTDIDPVQTASFAVPVVSGPEQPYPSTEEQPAADPVQPTEPPVPAVSVPEQPMLCPRCGAALILRTAKKGPYTGKQFYGCSNFPGCKYFASITQP